MILITLYFLLCSLIFSQREFPSFQEYKSMFNKTYSEQQDIVREEIYRTNIEIMKTIVEFEPDVNGLTDWSQKQFDRLKNLEIQNRSQVFNENIPVRNVRLGAPTPTYPQSLDWRQKGVVTPAKSQNGCGSCAAFAAVAVAESKLIIEGRYDQSIDLSQNYILHCQGVITCEEGGKMEVVMRQSLRLPQQFQSRYDPKTQSPQCPDRKIHIAKSSVSYFSFGDNQIIADLQNGPVAATVHGDGYEWKFYGQRSGIIRCPPRQFVDHAVLIVGYTPTYWIVKNSWGTSFGKNGFANVSRLRNQSCLLGNTVYYFVGNPYEDNSTSEMKYNSSSPDVEHDNAFQQIDQNQWGLGQNTMAVIFVVVLLVGAM